MPSTYTTSSEAQSEQQPVSADHQHASLPDILQDKPRRFSSKGDHPGKTLGSGTPHIHHFLTSTSPVTEHLRKGGSIPAPKPGLRRHSSAEPDQLRHHKTRLDGAWLGGRIASDRSGSTSPHEIRDHKRAKLSQVPAPAPAPVAPQPVPFTFEMTRPGSSGRRSSTIRETLQEHQVVEDRSSTRGFTHGPTYGDAFTFLEREASARDVSQSMGDESTWTSTVVTQEKSTPMSRSTSSSSSVSSSPRSDAPSEKTADTDVSFHEHEIAGDETPIAPVPVAGERSFRVSTNKRHSRGSTSDPDRYGTPEMPRGTAKLPHIPASYLTPRMPNQGHAKYLPRAEKLPMSGYELLASSISSSGASANMRSSMSAFLGSSSASPRYAHRRNSSASFASAPSGVTEEEVTIKPIYRRFEVLNHRLLLQLQDELSELEEQLHRLDTTDTQTRRLRSSILPASRRAEFLAGGELQWHKTDILSKIGFKLGQYNHLLSSFTSTRDLPAPSLSDVTEYRTYLATRQPICEVETRFLDPIDDLVTLAAQPEDHESSVHSSERVGRPTTQVAHEYLQSLRINDEPIVTPIPGTMHGNSWLIRHNRLSHGSRAGSQSSAASSSPRFARPGSSLEPLGRHHTPPLLASPRSPPTPLREVHSVTTSEDKDCGTSAPNIGERPPARVILHIVTAVAVAILVPVLSFPVISSFVGRMAVVLLVGLSVAGCVRQSGDVTTEMKQGSDLACSAAIYAAVMAVAAGITV